MEIRPATTADAPALQALAERDCAAVPAGELIVAAAGGRLLAAYAPHSDEAIADPFERTAAVVAALRAYSAPRTSRSARIFAKEAWSFDQGNTPSALALALRRREFRQRGA